ncbi:MAG: hypothetical protein FWD61_18530 [Phycisphaerales bacterium]|nr:hypothetical protein [Phycisphaerales bacterium]
MKASILDLRRRMPDILKALERRESVIISYRGKDRALLTPLPGETKASLADLLADPAFGLWKDRAEYADPVAAVRRMRKRRYAL